MDVNKYTTGLVANSSQMQKVKKKVRQTSLDLIFTLTQDVLNSQLEQADKLDSKADSTQVSATALIGAALVLEAVLIPLHNSLIIRIMQIALLLPLLVVHVIVVRSASGAYGISGYHGVSNPKTLIEKYLKASERETKRKILTAMEFAYAENEKIIDKKVMLIDRAIKWRTAEATILVIVLLIQVISVLFILGTV